MNGAVPRPSDARSPDISRAWASGGAGRNDGSTPGYTTRVGVIPNQCSHSPAVHSLSTITAAAERTDRRCQMRR